MKTSIRNLTLMVVLALTMTASAASAIAEFIFQVSFAQDGPATLEFGVKSDKTNVPEPPIGTPGDTVLKHIFFVGAGDETQAQAVDYEQLACSYLPGDTSTVWKLQSIADATVYFKLVEGTAPSNLTIDDGETDAVPLADGDSAKLVKGKTYVIRCGGATINPLGTIHTSMIKGSDTVTVPFPEGYAITPDGWNSGKTSNVYAFDANGNAIEGAAPEISSADVMTTPFTVANLPEDTAFFQFAFDYMASGNAMRSVVIVDVTTPVSTTLEAVEFAAYDSEGAIVVEDDNNLQGTADPVQDSVVNVFASNDSRDGFVKLTYSITTDEETGPAQFPLALDFLPETDKYEVVIDEGAPMGATKIEYGDTSIVATPSDGQYTFNGMDIPKGATATLTLVLNVASGAEQVNVSPVLVINDNDWRMPSLYLLPQDNSGTLDIDGNGIVNEEDALMFYLFVALGGVDDPDGMYVDDIIQGIDETVVDAEAALDLMKGVPSFLDYDGNGTIMEEDALMMYLFIALGGVDDPDGMYVDDIIQGIDETAVDAETALENFKKYSR